MKTVDFKEARQRLTRQSLTLMLDKEILDINSLLSVFAKEYLEIDIIGRDKKNPDSDMLLFEYGIYDWTGEGKRFNLSLKGRPFIDADNECCYFGFTIYYDHQKVVQIGDYSKPCQSKETLNQWTNEIILTEGYQKIQNIPFEHIHFDLEKPH